MTVLDSPPVNAAGPAPGSGRAHARRTELAAFLKACRARVAPGDVGLPPGLRRRTPGLRREEVAQLAGVGVTWYTWLEQGRPINASEQVLSAIARALLLDEVQRAHLYRLAGLPADDTVGASCPATDPALQKVLDALAPMPAAISNRAYDILAYNAGYDALFPGATRSVAPHGRRNSMWCALTVPDCCNPFVNRDEELPRMVGVMRAAYASHVGEPGWERWVRELCTTSSRFRELWATQQVAPPTTTLKVFRHAAVGEIRVQAAYLTMPGSPELYLVAYTPERPVDQERMAWITANPGAPVVDHQH
ncbi:helix-turn-helix transcriptional regulator [Kitasatospora sp. NBC_01302]|uniref:helix-turn-helix transcriptional regulator n=1 Tax=Kitasatospora sp. NBC_01302 TaxID=2903575 RepID=UPI002E0F1431|nr:helix-turn-helix transcriptional regulator [Kitasatospora sp. NBC_01302]